jgi:uncharacterized protein
MKRLLKGIIKTVLVLFVLLNIMAAFHAYKFTHFYDDAGIRMKKPEDWTTTEKLGAMLFGQKFAKSQNKVQPDTAYTTVKITTTDDVKLEGWHLTHTDTSKGTIITFHGHGGSKSGNLREAQEFFTLGYNVLLMDLRAHGGSEGNTCVIGMKEDADVKAAYDYVAAKGEKNIILWGISLGAASITHAIASTNIKPSKLILEMPFGSLMKAVEGRVHIMGLPKQPISSLLMFWGGVEQWRWTFGMEPFKFAKKISCPVLLQKGALDTRVTNEETQWIYDNIPTSKKLVLYDSCGHESLCKKENAKWRQEVTAFLAQ